ncbi:MAG TPA: hypothetical protein VMU36_10260 [Spirochaetia bacterium]|nr:hypothetical protein [Spirochaetia bacterium]
MKRFGALAVIMILIFPASRVAADQPAPTPELVLPEVTLDIRDLSVENVQAMLPPEGPPVIVKADVILPSGPELLVQQPARTLAVEGSDPLGGTATPQNPLATQATLGLGSQNRVVGDLNVSTTGGNTQSSLAFSHETADGISDQKQGSGFNTRDDTIAGDVSGKLGPFDGGLQGSYSEKELGLQQLAPSYVYRLGRNLDGKATLGVQPLDWLTVEGSVRGVTDSLTLASAGASAPGQENEYKGATHLSAKARTGELTIGVSGDYDYHLAQLITGSDDQVQRLKTGVSLSLNLPASLLLEGSVALFVSSRGSTLLPFSIHATAAPLSALTIDASAGYRVVPYDEGDILALNPYLIPVNLVDDSGWFADGGFQLALTSDVSLRAKLSFMSSSNMLTSNSFASGTYTGDLGTGLYQVNQISANRLLGDAGVRWTVTPGVTLDAGWKRELMERPSFAPVDSMTAEVIAMETTGAYGGQLSGTLLTGLPPNVQVPEIDIGGFVRLSQPAQLHLDLYDVLWPLVNNLQRYGPSLYPYVEPGFRAVASVRLSF